MDEAVTEVVTKPRESYCNSKRKAMKESFSDKQLFTQSKTQTNAQIKRPITEGTNEKDWKHIESLSFLVSFFEADTVDGKNSC